MSEFAHGASTTVFITIMRRVFMVFLYRYPAMGGQKVNAKGRPVGSQLSILKDGKEFSQVRWPQLRCINRIFQFTGPCVSLKLKL